MGKLMRQYWLPACLSSELVADGDPLRLMLLGEQLIAFRDSGGPDRRHGSSLPAPLRLAVLRPQRGRRPALRLSRLEIRRRRQLPRHAERAADQDFRHRVKAKAYQAVERGGLVYVYMGEREQAPPLPALEALLCPPEDADVSAAVMRECNWLQALEGDIDTSHFGFLHTGKVEIGRRRPRPSRALPADRPRAGLPCHRDRLGHDVRGVPSGGAGHLYYRFAHFACSVLDACSRTAS